MERHSRAVRRYLREVRGWLPCSRKLKRGILKRIENTIREYLAENQNAAYEELTKRFGLPQQIAATYVEEMGTDELLRDLRIRRRVLKIVTGTMACILALWFGVVLCAYVYNMNFSDSYITVTTEEIGQVLPESRESK